MKRSVLATTSTAALMVLSASLAHALEPDVKCESGKVKVTGKYAACRLNAEAKALKTGDPADFTTCDEVFDVKVGGLEENGGTACPTEGDAEGIASDVTKFAQGIIEKVKHPGLRGKARLLTPAAEYWLEDDGVEPETPGCHVAYEDEDCTTAAVGADTVIGEACVTYGAEVLLLETNPDAPLCHEHHKEHVITAGPAVTDEDYSGHPYLYSCEEYCQGRYGVSGSCVAVPNVCPPGGSGTIASARCQCVLAPPD